MGSFRAYVVTIAVSASTLELMVVDSISSCYLILAMQVWCCPTYSLLVVWLTKIIMVCWMLRTPLYSFRNK
jgi:hypothetical protein